MSTALGFLSGWATTILSGLGDAAVKGAVILAAAGIAALVMRRASAAARHLLWLVATTAALLMPALCLLLPQWRVLPARVTEDNRRIRVAAEAPPPPPPLEAASGGLPSPQRNGSDHTTTSAAADTVPAATATPAREDRPATAERAVGGVPSPGAGWTLRSLSPVLLLAWLVGAAAVLSRLASGVLLLRRVWRRASPPADARWAQRLGRLAREAGLRRRPELRFGDGGAMPMTWGVLRPKLLLPAEAGEWADERARVVLLHELAHVRRRDCLAELVAQIACAAYWFNPLAWFAAARMRDERERACDDLVTSTGAAPTVYARHLLHVAASFSGGNAGALARGGPAVAMARRSKLEGRLLALLDGRRRRRPPGRAAVLLTVLAAAALAVPAAMLRRAPAAPAPATRPAAPPAEAGATQVRIAGEVTDADLKPVPGAEIEFIAQRYREGSLDFLGVEVLAKARADERGAFEIRLNRWPAQQHLFLRATATGFAHGAARVERGNDKTLFYEYARHEPSDRPSIILPPAARLSGRVVDEAGKPVAGAVVAYRRIEDVARTGADGRFLFEKAAPSRYGVYSGSDQINVRHPDFVPAEVRFDPRKPIEAGKEFVADVTLSRGVLLTGTLTEEGTGKPLRGFGVGAVPSPREEGPGLYAYSSEDGRYEMRVPATRLQVRAFAVKGLGAADDNYYSTVDIRNLRLKPGAAAGASADFQFRRGRVIAGTVRVAGAAAGQPVPSFYVEATPTNADPNGRGQRSQHHEAVAADGTFRINRLKPGRYDLVVTSAGRGRLPGPLATQVVEVRADGPEAAEVRIEVPGDTATPAAALRGTVRHADGTPAASATVNLHPADSPADPEAHYGPRTYTAADGKFELAPADPSRKWTLWARDAKGTASAFLEFTDARQFDRPVKIALAAGANISGRVRDAAGNGVGGVTVVLGEQTKTHDGYVGTRPLVTTTTDAQGSYTLAGVVLPRSRDNFVISAWRRDANDRQRTHQSAAYEGIKAEPGGKLTGYDFTITETASSVRIVKSADRE